MNYELAKKLKDAGFPMKTTELELYGSTPSRFLAPAEEGGFYNEPTLSELIETCGSKFDRLTRNEMTDDSAVWRVDCYDMAVGNFGEGSTPEEAVANLWLALNEKDHG